MMLNAGQARGVLIPYEEAIDVAEEDELPIMAFLMEGGPDTVLSSHR